MIFQKNIILFSFTNQAIWTYFIISFIVLIVVLIIITIIFYWKNKELKTKFNALQHQHNQLNTLINILPDYIYIKDRDSRFILANKQLANVVGEDKPEKLIGKTDKDYYPANLADKFYNDEKKIMESRIPLIGHIEKGINENGSEIYLSTSKIPLINQSGNIAGIVGIGRDITKIKEFEKQLIRQTNILNVTNRLLEERQIFIENQTEELIKKNKQLNELVLTKDKLLSIIAHDLRNTFNSIMGFSEILALKFNKLDEIKKQMLIKQIHQSSKNVYLLLENLLEWSSSKTQNLQFNPEKINLFDIIVTTINLFKVAAEKKSISIINNTNKYFHVFADKNMIFTILRNLISNALKFTKDGYIEIDALSLENNFLEIRIKDTGIGIEESILNSLFEIDKSVIRSGTEGEKGSGLGLVICKEFIEINGGKIKVESTDEKGTSFFFTLPMVNIESFAINN